ncbi:MAG: YsnF/AvaK domain-containing protein [Acidobacteriaceae bacterium]|nr:YsnF/AvaK domain-containing protein [Acidobacteriaceae bacterium]
MHDKKDVVIPVIREEVQADAVPKITGGVRVTKRTESHDEIVEQELRKTHVEVKRVKTERVVDGPQPAQRDGKTLIVPIVSEVIRIQKQWVVTEEIHITENEARETVQNKVTLNRERADVERIDEAGNVIASDDGGSDDSTLSVRQSSILQKRRRISERQKERKLLAGSGSLLKNPRIGD